MILAVCTYFASSNCTLICSVSSHITPYQSLLHQVLYSPLSINQDDKDIVRIIKIYDYLNISIDINIFFILATFHLVSLHRLSDTYSRLTIIISCDCHQDHPGYRKTWTIQRLSRNIENKNS